VGGLGRIDLQGDVDLLRFRGVHGEVRREREAARQHPDDASGDSVELDRSAENRRITAEARLPEGVSEHGDGRATGAILLRREPSAEDRRRAQRLERVRRDESGAQPNRLSGPGQIRLIGLPGRDTREARTQPAVVEELAVRDPGLRKVHPAAPDHHPAVRLRVGQRRQEDRANDREDRGRRAHREGERRDRRRRESGRPAQPARRVSEVPEEIFHAASLRTMRSSPCPGRRPRRPEVTSKKGSVCARRKRPSGGRTGPPASF
jgi:hypothetical protein